MTNKINISNVYEWLCSTGYLLPRNDRELIRYEKLYPPGSTTVKDTAIDPFAIINKSRIRKKLSFEQEELPPQEQEALRMAARKHADLPKDILDQILRNQEKSQDGSDNQPENEEGDH